MGPEETMLMDVNPPQENIDKFWIRQTEVDRWLTEKNKKFSGVQRVILRICKLLFYRWEWFSECSLIIIVVFRIKSVFVKDGAPPQLKKATLLWPGGG